MSARVVLLPGDGIGPEVVAEARRVLELVSRRFDLALEMVEAPVGGAAMDACGDPLPAGTMALCREADAVLLGAVGGPRWADPGAAVRPEQGLLRLRREFELFANLRPVRVHPALRGRAPLRPDLLEGVDLLIVRELTGGIYFGERQEEDADGLAYDTMLYSVGEVERIAHVAFRAARGRRRHVTSVDKANVLASMRLWRRVVSRVAGAYPDVSLEHVLVDACAMYLMRRPATFDVVLAGNCFGDILSDEAATLSGSLGLLPSACLGSGTLGVYEPIHGSAPEIAGAGIANPLATILSAAMLLRHSLLHESAARAVEDAVDGVLADGVWTADLVGPGERAASTREVADAVLDRLGARRGAGTGHLRPV